jgi:TetR/AcrR family transcriptional repressor of nem operon
MSSAPGTKERLLDAMIEAMWERGYSAISVDSVCEKAGVHKGSFYHFFRSKSELACHALDHLWTSRTQPRMDELFSPTKSPLCRLAALMKNWHENATESLISNGRVLGCPYLTIGSETSNAEPEVASKARDMLNRFQRYLESCLLEAKASGEVVVDDPLETAASIFAMMEGYAAQSRIHNDPERVRHCAASVERLLGVRGFAGSLAEPEFTSN